MSIEFTRSDVGTLGVEWEFALVDRVTRDLSGCADAVIERVLAEHGEQPQLHRELLRNTVELTTRVCRTTDEAVGQLEHMIGLVQPAAADCGVDLFSAGTHPFAHWTAQQLTDGHRYEELIARTQWWGRQMLIWGVHVHVGCRGDLVMPLVSALLRYYPHLLALSASSPIWAGDDTGYASNRAMMFQQLPTAGLPFDFATWGDFETYADDLITTGVIDQVDEIRWDIRPAPHLGTVEIRVSDGVSSRAEMRALVALTHCLAVWLHDRLAAGEELVTLPPWHVQENKWRAARYGLDAWVITGPGNAERLVCEDLADLLEDLAPTARRLGCLAELRSVADLVDRGASYARQREVARRTGGDLVAVVDSVVRELDLP
ncbi:glutamate--cysteine ligase [Alteromonas gracilis]